MSNNVVVWKEGERLAQEFLKKKKYKIIETNYNCGFGEIDIIAQDKKTLVFVEVKAKSSTVFGLPREMVGVYKQRKIKQVANYYIVQNEIKQDCRFDVIEVLNGKVNHIESAF